jgi:hypothetical protein
MHASTDATLRPKRQAQICYMWSPEARLLRPISVAQPRSHATPHHPQPLVAPSAHCGAPRIQPAPRAYASDGSAPRIAQDERGATVINDRIPHLTTPQRAFTGPAFLRLSEENYRGVRSVVLLLAACRCLGAGSDVKGGDPSFSSYDLHLRDPRRTLQGTGTARCGPEGDRVVGAATDQTLRETRTRKPPVDWAADAQRSWQEGIGF